MSRQEDPHRETSAGDGAREDCGQGLHDGLLKKEQVRWGKQI